MKAKFICRSAIIAAIYAMLTIFLQPLSYGVVQIRFSEALTVLPCLMVEGVWGLVIGCFIANCFSPFAMYDMIFGTLITLVSAILTRLIAKKLPKCPYIAIIPPVILNAVFLPLMWLGFGIESVFWINVLSIFVSQTIVVYAVGLPLFYAIKPLYKIYK